MKVAVTFIAAVISWGTAVPAAAEEWLTGEDTWGGRKALPAVVNPVLSSPLQEVLSLRGDWEFVTTEPGLPGKTPLRHPGFGGFFGKPWPGSRIIQVPGCWEAQGVGEPGMSIPWDTRWDNCAKPLRWIYMGEAWYRKTVEIPGDWQGKRVWLKVGGVRSQGWFWVNGTPVAWVNSYCGTYKYDITDLIEPGKPAIIVAAVNNEAPSRKGSLVATHKFGGLYRDVELEATPDTRIDDAWVRGDFDSKTAEVNAVIGIAPETEALKNPVLRVEIKTADGKVAGTGSQPLTLPSGGADTVEVVCPVPLEPFHPWSPESPALYHAKITLLDGETPVSEWMERFGVRKIEVRGDKFFLNDKPFFVRGYGDNNVYPITLSSPVSREEHIKHMRIAKAAGFNTVRFHTHCEWPEYFEAADEMGLMIQPELPYYSDYPTEAFTFDPFRDLIELNRHYRRYVSYSFHSTGNEGILGRPLDEKIYQFSKRLDPDRLMIHQDGGYNTPQNSDFLSGPHTEWETGSHKTELPFVCHEYLNLSVKQDPRLESQFTGAMQPPVTMADRDALLEAAGIDRRWGDACQDASHVLQQHYQKRGIEQARIDPACDGYSVWTIVDVIVRQGGTYSAQGIFDPFWGTKNNGTSPEDFRQFNDQSAILLKTDPAPRIAVSGDTVQADFWITYYGDAPLEQTRLKWTLRTETAVLASGEADCGEVALGSTRLLAGIPIAIPEVEKPVQATLEAGVADGAIQNQWDFWIFPKREKQNGSGIAVAPELLPALEKLYSGLVPAGTPQAANAQVLIAESSSPAVSPALADGKKVILINGSAGAPNVSLGWWAMGNQVGTAFATHPALGDFPHNGFLTPLAFRIMKQGRPLPFAGMLPDEMMVVGEGLNGYFLYLGEGRVGGGRALMSFGLDLISGTPEGTCLLDGMIRYVRSDAFDPQGEVALQDGRNGWQETLSAGDTDRSTASLPAGAVQLDVARATSGKNELVWETRPAPEDVQSHEVYEFVWSGGMGWFQEPAASFSLYLNDEKLLDLPETSQQDVSWTNDDETVTLKYVRDVATAEFGTFTLTLPSAKVTPGKPLTLKVVGNDANSGRWFGVLHPAW